MKENQNKENNEQKEIYDEIKKNPLVWKFCFYGFFKNLKFFEPYLLIMFLVLGYNMVTWGFLMVFQEIFTYLFEVPSGIAADKFGKKTILMSCFIFYILSFVLYFIGLDPANPNFIVLIFASIFFGFGEAFRSGTHKAMELMWMDKHNLLTHKTYIYGRTRSYSLLGSTVSSILSIIFLLNIPADRMIFLITIIPYVIDFFLIGSYPSYMNEHKKHEKNDWDEFKDGFKGLKNIFTDKKLGKALLSISSFNGIFKSLKDYIQPIIKLMIVALLISFISDPTVEEQGLFTKLILGLMYGVFYFISSFTSKNAYKFQQKFQNTKVSMDVIYDLFALVLLTIGIFIYLEMPFMIITLYLFLYLGNNLRRPIGVDYISSIIEKEQRATMLSVESLIKSIFILIFSLLFGWIWDLSDLSKPLLFIGLAVVILLLNHFYFMRKSD